MAYEQKLHLSPVVTTALPRKEGYALASRGISYCGEALRLFVSSEKSELLRARQERAGFASFPLARTHQPYAALLEVTGASGSYEIELDDLSENYPIVQLLPEEKILIVSRRCQRFKDGTSELNARVFDRAGQPVGEFLLGDGIENLQVDGRGNIWVGYSDEGIYGNYGWGGGGDASPIGAAGLVCFDASGRPEWKYEPISGTDFISELYALNVCDEEAWAYYYTDFPIVRIGPDRKVSAWPTATSGARAFAVGNGKILLFGGYSEKRFSTRWFGLGEKLVQEVALSLPGQENIAESSVVGRGDILHVFADDSWYQFSTESLP